MIMTVKNYLKQVRLLDMRINAKFRQVKTLDALVQRCSAAIAGMPLNADRAASSLAAVSAKITGLITDAGRDVEALAQTKQDIACCIGSVADPKRRTVLEKRYLCFLSWEQIASDMCFSEKHLQRLHNSALEEIQTRMTASADAAQLTFEQEGALS